MAKKSKEYWNKRFEALELAQIEKGAAYFAELEKQYTQAARQVQSDINKWYARFANNNEITLQEARKLLTANELEEFKWDVMQYVEKGRDNAVSEQWMKQLENASAKWHISRLEALKVQMQNHVEVLYGNEQDDIADLMSDIYTGGYYHTAYEIQKGFNIGYDLMKLDTDKVEKLISKPWAADGSNFSDRIWKQKSQLVSELHNNMTQAIVTGKNPAKVTDEIAKRFDVSKGQAGRLVMTETAFFASASTKDAFNELDVEQYEILATLDTKTSDTCRELDGKVFKMSEYEVGVTAPPFHVWCRTTTVPYFDDEFELGSKRAARNEDGETYYVPADMKYEEWEDKFINGGNKEDLEFVQEELDLDQEDRVRLGAQKMKPKNKNGEEIQFSEAMQSDEKWQDSLDILKTLSNEYDTYLTEVRWYEKGENTSHAAGDVSFWGRMRLSSRKKSTAIHEFAHSLSSTIAEKEGTTNCPDFWKEIRKVRTEYKKARRTDPSVSISFYAEDNVDEFFAEAFTQAKMKQLGMDYKEEYGEDTTYSDKVLAIADKYFKKEPLENVGKSDKMVDIVFKSKLPSSKVTNDKKTVITSFSELPMNVQKKMSDITFDMGNSGSACDYENGIIYVAQGAKKQEIDHEIGHLIEYRMMDKKAVTEYKKHLVEGLSGKDIFKETYYNTTGEAVDIFIVKGDRFVSEYQGRIYASSLKEALNDDGSINTDLMLEVISEPFRMYQNDKSTLLKYEKIIELIEGAIQ